MVQFLSVIKSYYGFKLFVKDQATLTIIIEFSLMKKK